MRGLIKKNDIEPDETKKNPIITSNYETKLQKGQFKSHKSLSKFKRILNALGSGSFVNKPVKVILLFIMVHWGQSNIISTFQIESLCIRVDPLTPGSHEPLH